MMDHPHPDELELLEYADDGARTERGREVAAHVAGCPACADVVHELQAGQAALRAAPRLQLPERRRAEISRVLAAERRRGRSPFFRGRLAALLAPVAVAAVVVAVVGNQLDWRGGGDEVAGRAGPAAEEREERAEDAGAAAEPDAGSGDEESRTAAPEAGAAMFAGPVVSVAGPPAEVVTVLRSEGLNARISGGRVVVSGAEPRDVLDALDGRARGRVRVVLEER